MTLTFENVSKAYRLSGNRASLADALSDGARRVFRRQGRAAPRMLWALAEVSFDVRPGEVLGIIGPNGAGKSTVLKLISNITRPTSGTVSVRGRVSGLLELGAGFHPDLTGRENIFLNAAMLGMPLRETRRLFDSIVDFAGIETFLDTPVKRYSSGMYVRLAFAVAAHTRADILLVDEVLAVGDAAFSRRCMQRMRQLRRDGTTIVFVSHNLYLVESMCNRGLFLAEGRIRSEGAIATVLRDYQGWRNTANGQAALRMEEPCHDGDAAAGLAVTAVEVRGGSGIAEAFVHDEGVELWVRYRALRRVPSPRVYLKIIGDAGTCCMIRTPDYGIRLPDLEGAGTIRLAVHPLQLTPGTYVVEAEVLDGSEFVVLDDAFSPPFRVSGSPVGREGVFVPFVPWARVVRDIA